MIIYNAEIFTEEEIFVRGSILVKDGRIDEIIPGEISEELRKQYACEEWIDADGMYAIPGMIDMHLHGCRGYDFCDGTPEAMEEIARYELSLGVTCIAPATMTLPVEKLIAILDIAAEYKKREPENVATLVGINMEGPFISKTKKGAQDEKNILPCDASLVKEFAEISKGLVGVIGIAPEQAGSMDFVREAKKYATVSIAHSNADYDTALQAFNMGAGHVTHLFNGMSAFGHREPGIVGAALDSEAVTAELICDGLHVHPAMVRGAFRMFGAKRMILISDSMRATGMSDGVYQLGGLDVKVKGKRAVTVADGALAGSVTSLPECVGVAVREMQLPLTEVIPTVTINPARRLGISEKYGSLTKGKQADIVLLDSQLEVQKIWKNGKNIR